MLAGVAEQDRGSLAGIVGKAHVLDAAEAGRLFGGGHHRIAGLVL